MLLTYSGSKEDFKIKALKLTNFVLSVSNRVKERFKL